MASAEEQAHAIRLLKIHRRNLDRLEVQKAELGGDINLALENQIDEEKANIAALEPIANPPAKPSPKVEAFVKQTTPGEIDLMMLYLQGAQLNQRMTKAEEQNQHIIEEQARGAVWRLDIKETVEASERARQAGAPFIRRVVSIALGVSVLALMVSCAALAAVLR